MHFWLIDINDFCEANVSLLKNNNGIISYAVLKFRFCEHVNKPSENCSTALKSFNTGQTFVICYSYIWFCNEHKETSLF